MDLTFSLFSDGGDNAESIGMLDKRTTTHLDALLGHFGITLQAVIPWAHLDGAISGHKKKTQEIKISINVVGPEFILDDVEKILDTLALNTQHPVYIQHGFRYINPQWLSFGTDREDLTHLVGPSSADPLLHRLAEGVEATLGRLNKIELSELASQLEFDAQYSVLQRDGLKTQLKP